MKTEGVMPENFTVLLGLKPIEVNAPVTFERKVETETVEWNPAEFDPTYEGPIIRENVIKSVANRVYVGGKLFATTSRWNLKKDLKTGHMTLRLFKNKTTLH